jgi:hypothetical protein
MKENVMNDHITINDKKILIDPDDYDRVTQYPWHIQSGRDTVRVKTRGLNTSLQKFIMGVDDKDLTVYNVNGNAWDNRKKNLKVATRGEAIVYIRDFNRSREDAIYANQWFTPTKVSFL